MLAGSFALSPPRLSARLSVTGTTCSHPKVGRTRPRRGKGRGRGSSEQSSRCETRIISLKRRRRSRHCGRRPARAAYKLISARPGNDDYVFPPFCLQHIQTPQRSHKRPPPVNEAQSRHCYTAIILDTPRSLAFRGRRHRLSEAHRTHGGEKGVGGWGCTSVSSII